MKRTEGVYPSGFLFLCRWLLQLQHHSAEAHHPLRAIPATQPSPCGALRALAAPLAALLTGLVFPWWHSGSSWGCHDIHSRPGTLLLFQWLQGCRSKNPPLSVSGGAADFNCGNYFLKRQTHALELRATPEQQRVRDTSCRSSLKKFNSQDSLWFWKVILGATVQKRLLHARVWAQKLDFLWRHCAVPPGGLGAVCFSWQ